jgi:hypothetical protein
MSIRLRDMESRLDAVAEENARCYYYRPCGRGYKVCIDAQTPGRRANACWEGRLMESFQPILRNSIRQMARNLEDPPAQDVATACCIVHDKSLP